MYETPCVCNPTATPVTWFRLKPVPPRIPTVNMGVDQIPRTQVPEVSGEDDNATLPQTLVVLARCRRSSTIIPRSHGRQIQLTSPDRHRYCFTGMPLRSLPPASTSRIHTSTTSPRHHLAQCHTLHTIATFCLAIHYILLLPFPTPIRKRLPTIPYTNPCITKKCFASLVIQVRCIPVRSRPVTHPSIGVSTGPFCTAQVCANRFPHLTCQDSPPAALKQTGSVGTACIMASSARPRDILRFQPASFKVPT